MADAAISCGNSLRRKLLEIFQAAVASVRPDQALLRHLRINGNNLEAGGASYDLNSGAIRVVGAGKGAAPMAQALEKLLGDKIQSGLVCVKYDHSLPLQHINITEAAHPVPDAAGVRAADAMLQLAGQCAPDDLLICLFTGGASALLPAPVAGVSLSDFQRTTSALLASGADITELNAVRKHISRLSGGQLARAAASLGAQVISIIVSDVIGDDLAVIASGPTAPDASTYGQCLEIIAKYNMKLPASVLEHLQKGARGLIPETPKPGEKFFKKVENVIAASNAQALAAAADKARELGLTAHMQPEPMQGEAVIAAVKLCDKIKGLAAAMKPGDAGICLLAGGETTVTIKGNGRGGRNQEMALAAAMELAGERRIAALFGGTDGTDGPTDAAGGFAFGDTAAKMGGKAEAYLAANDSYAALKEAGDLLITGPTLTNVMDVAVLTAEETA